MAKWFGTDGIRGRVGESPMVPEFALALGQAAGAVVRGEKRDATVVIGRDTRSSGTMLQEALDAGLMSSGVHLVDAGVIPTPGVSWLVRHLKADAGIMISASHNPADQNGIKFFHSNGRKLPEALEQAIEARIEQAQKDPHYFQIHAKIGNFHDGAVFQELYIRDLLSEHPKMNLDGVKLVMDCANGAASFIAPEVFSRLGANVVAIHGSPNGMNINLNAGSEHVRRSMREMSLIIEHHEAQFGLAFDGDADRVVFVDKTGSLVDGDHMLGILARYFQDRRRLRGEAVVTTVMRNSGLKNRLEQAGIKLYETPVGDKYVADKIFELRDTSNEEGLVGLGGEQAGHILIVNDDHPTGDGIRSALYVIRAWLESGEETLESLAAGVGKTPQIIASAQVNPGVRLSRAELDALEVNTLKLPGIVRVNLRYSGTEPLMRAMLESDGSVSEDGLGRIALEICRKVQEVSGTHSGSIDLLNVTRGGVVSL